MPLHLVSSPRQPEPPRYVELHARSAFSLLDGASTPERLVEIATRLGLRGLAILDRDDLGGAVRLSRAADEAGLRPLYGATLTLEGELALPLLVEDRRGWRNLCELISRARMSSPRGAPRLPLRDLERHSEGLFALTGGLDGPVARALLDGDEPRALERLGYRTAAGM